MAAYDFASVAGSVIAFDAGFDTLNFTAGSAGQLRFVAVGPHVRVFLGNQWVVLHGASYADLGEASLWFADGSMFHIGGAGDDALTGTIHGDWLDGRGGADTLTGGLGDDTYRVDNGGDVVVENAGGGIDTMQSTLANTTIAANVENLWMLSAGSADATGNALSNIVYAGAGDNNIDAGAGRDTISYLYATGAVTVTLAGGAQSVTGASGTDHLTGFENAVGSAYADALSGNGGANLLNGLAGNDTLYAAAGNDTLYGGAGDDSLRGGAGADLMNGGAGNDIYHVDDAGDVVVEGAGGGIDRIDTLVSLTLGANIENGRALAGANIALTGNALDNVIYGSFGNATLAGGGGHDTLSYALMPVGALMVGVTVNLTLGVVHTGYADYYDQGVATGFIDLVGSDASDILIGDEQANRIEGGGGGDFLYGYGGADTLVGGAGDDYYQLFGGETPDVVVEDADGGSGDYLFYFSSDYVVPDYIEFVRVGLDTGVTLTGNASDNHIYDGGGSDTYDALGGNDTLSFVFAPVYPDGVVASLVTGVATHEGGTVDHFSGFENLAGGGSDDHLTGDDNVNGLGGGAGNDTLEGGGGDDWLDGSAGTDQLIGGAGADRFVFQYATDTQGAFYDSVVDFNPGEGDTIDISLIPSGIGIGEQAAYVFIGTSAFSADATGQLRYDAENGFLLGSSDADTDAEFIIGVPAGLTLSESNFIL